MERSPALLAPIMASCLSRAALVALLALAGPAARADVYTWKDPAGRLHVSNLAPPEGVHVESVVHEDPAKPSPSAEAARAYARDTEMQALTERVVQLQDEVERAKQQAVLPPVVYSPAPAAPVQVTVNVMPPAPAEAVAPAAVGYPGYAPYPGYGFYSGYYPPYPGYPGLPRDYCEPTVFGCPTFGYPVGVVVLNTGHFGSAKRFAGMRAPHRPGVVRPMPVGSGYPRR